ncbi:polyketide cyclase/dehydrase [marine bacterium AO1-C]|nr:polyketide cyclase/dehydrase [marine bacterium AO1-C]
MTNLNSTTPNGKAVTIKKTFSRETAVSIEIEADQAVIWALLTNASDFSRWNSTIISIDGEIAQGEKIKLKATLAPKRTFKIKIKEVIPEKKMVWGDGMGNRFFTLTKQADNKVLFHMREKMGSPMFPLFASQIPPFDDAFEQYAADLKKEAESIAAN